VVGGEAPDESEYRLRVGRFAPVRFVAGDNLDGEQECFFGEAGAIWSAER
jgi:hypothetical protein